MRTQTRTARVSILLGIALVASSTLLASGCRTAKRGAGYKRLISSYAEAITLSELTERRLDEALASGADADHVDKLTELNDEITAMRDRWHDSLDLNRREGWNRTKMNWCWKRYVKLYPEDKALFNEYRWQRRISIDELRSRRTPLTHDQRFRRAPAPKDPLPYGNGVIIEEAQTFEPTPQPATEGAYYYEPAPIEPEPVDIFEVTPAEPTIETLPEPEENSVNELLIELLEDSSQN